MRYAIIENGVVVNQAESDSELAENWIPAGNGKIGDLWDGSVFTTPGKSAPKLYAEKEDELIRAFDEAVSTSLGKYVDNETKSWWKQEKQAFEWQADSNAPVKLIRSIALENGAPLSALVTQIIAKADAYEPVYGGILGKKQRLLDDLYTIDTNAHDAIDLINAINW